MEPRIEMMNYKKLINEQYLRQFWLFLKVQYGHFTSVPENA